MLETHTNSPNVTNLSVEQLNAIDLLVQGLSDRDVAEKVNVAVEGVVSTHRTLATPAEVPSPE